jgi:nicotinamide riboside transporter PnuC
MIDTAIIEGMGLVALVVAVCGVLLNNYRIRACFCVWWFSNSLGIVIHLTAETPLYSMAAKDAVFLALAVWGYRQWGKGDKECR